MTPVPIMDTTIRPHQTGVCDRRLAPTHLREAVEGERGGEGRRERKRDRRGGEGRGREREETER